MVRSAPGRLSWSAAPALSSTLRPDGQDVPGRRGARPRTCKNVPACRVPASPARRSAKFFRRADSMGLSGKHGSRRGGRPLRPRTAGGAAIRSFRAGPDIVRPLVCCPCDSSRRRNTKGSSFTSFAGRPAPARSDFVDPRSGRCSRQRSGNRSGEWRFIGSASAGNPPSILDPRALLRHARPSVAASETERGRRLENSGHLTCRMNVASNPGELGWP